MSYPFVQSSIGEASDRRSFSALDFTAALALITVSSELAKRRASVSVSLICYESWSVGRLKFWREQLANGGLMPSLNVEQFRLPGRATRYSVTDGNHRCHAARLAGLSRVPVVIGSENWCDPAKFQLLDGALRSLERGNLIALAPGQMAALRSLGVRDER